MDIEEIAKIILLFMTTAALGDFSSSDATDTLFERSLKASKNPQQNNPSMGTEISLMNSLIENIKRVGVVIVATNDVVNVINEHMTETPAAYLSITSFTADHVKSLKMIAVKENIKLIYFIMPDTASTEPNLTSSSAALIRSIDYSNPIFLFLGSVHYVVRDILLRLKLYNTYFIAKEVTGLDLYLTCMFCNKGDDIIQKSYTYDPQSKFSEPFHFPLSFQNNFFKKTLKFGCRSVSFFNGGTGRIVATVGQYLDYKVEVVPHSTKVLQKYLEENKVDFDGCYNGFSSARYQWADFSFIYDLMGMKILTKKPERGYVWYSFVKPFGYQVWAGVFVSIPAVGLVLYILYLVNPLLGKKTFGDCIWDAFQIMAWNDIKVTNPSIPVVIHLSIYMLASAVLVFAYFGSVTSLLIQQPYLWPPMDSLGQFKESSMKFLVRRGLIEERLFEDDDVMPSKMHYVPFDKEKGAIFNYAIKPLEMVLENPKKFSLIGAGLLTYVSKFFMYTNGEHEFYFSDERINLSLIGFFFKKDKLYQEAINRKVMFMWGIGIIQHLREIAVFGTKLGHKRNAIKEKRYPPPPPSDKIQMIHLTGGFLILLVGYVSAIFCLAVEIAVFKVFESN